MGKLEIIKKLKNKKGMSHIEVILSFIIFLSFLIFLIAIFKPFSISQESDVYLNMLERGIENFSNVKVNISVLSLNQNPENCFYFNYNTSNIIVKNESYNNVGAFSEKNQEIKVYINGTENFYYIYSSGEFNESKFNETGCDKLGGMDYSLGLFRSFNMFSNNSLNNLKKRYETNYSTIKKELAIPETKDFSFSVRDSRNNNILNVTKKTPTKIKILARDIPIRIVYQDGTLKYAIMNIRIW